MPITRTFTEGDDRFGVNIGDSYELSFLDGADRLIVRGGSTTAYMGTGDDFVRVEGGLARIFGQAGADRFEIYGAGSRIYGGGGNDTFVLRGGADNVMTGSDGNDRFNILHDAAGVWLQGDEGNDSFYGHSNAISGHIFGGAGADRFFDFGNHGGRGVSLYGGSGNDLYRIDPSAPPTIVEYAGEGIDTVQVARGVTYTLGANLENLVVHSLASVGANSNLTGNELANRIVGGGGNDAISGLGGNDRLYGLGGHDDIYGGAGNDRIYGGAGGDNMSSGAGSDVFVYTSAADSRRDNLFQTNEDFILDWTYEDRIDLSAVDGNAELEGHQAFVFAGYSFGTPPPESEAGTLYIGGFGGELYVIGFTDSHPDIDFIISIWSDQGENALWADNLILG